MIRNELIEVLRQQGEALRVQEQAKREQFKQHPNKPLYVYTTQGRMSYKAYLHHPDREEL